MSERAHMKEPLHTQALENLSRRERARYVRARSLLASGGGAHSIALNNIPLAGPGVYEALLEESWACRFESPMEMVSLAEAALEVAKDFNPRSYGAGRVFDLQARAWGEVANAYRAADCLHQARPAFSQAFDLYERGTGDSYLKARLFDLEASLFGVSREFPLAFHRLTIVSNTYLSLGETQLAGRALITKALYTSYNGQSEEALRINKEGLALINQNPDSVLFRHAIHNNLLFLVELGRYAEAKRELFKNRRHLIYKDSITALRLRWLEGRISYGLGELISAEIALREVKTGLADSLMGLHEAIASLDLAMALLSQGNVDEAESMVIESRELFVALGMYSELLGTVIFLEECFRRQEVTPDLIQVTVTFLWRRALEIASRRQR